MSLSNVHLRGDKSPGGYGENEFIRVGRNDNDKWTILPRLCCLSKSSFDKLLIAASECLFVDLDCMMPACLSIRSSQRERILSLRPALVATF